MNRIDCEHCKDRLEDYHFNLLSHEERQVIHHHLDKCKLCRDQQDELLSLLRVMESIPESAPESASVTHNHADQIWEKVQRERRSIWLSPIRYAAAAILILTAGILIIHHTGSNPATSEPQSIEVAIPAGIIKVPAESILRRLNEETFELQKGSMHVNLSKPTSIKFTTPIAIVEILEPGNDGTIEFQIQLEDSPETSCLRKITTVSIAAGTLQVMTAFGQVTASPGEIVHAEQDQEPTKNRYQVNKEITNHPKSSKVDSGPEISKLLQPTKKTKIEDQLYKSKSDILGKGLKFTEQENPKQFDKKIKHELVNEQINRMTKFSGHKDKSKDELEREARNYIDKKVEQLEFTDVTRLDNLKDHITGCRIILVHGKYIMTSTSGKSSPGQALHVFIVDDKTKDLKQWDKWEQIEPFIIKPASENELKELARHLIALKVLFGGSQYNFIGFKSISKENLIVKMDGDRFHFEVREHDVHVELVLDRKGNITSFKRLSLGYLKLKGKLAALPTATNPYWHFISEDLGSYDLVLKNDSIEKAMSGMKVGDFAEIEALVSMTGIKFGTSQEYKVSAFRGKPIELISINQIKKLKN